MQMVVLNLMSMTNNAVQQVTIRPYCTLACSTGFPPLCMLMYTYITGAYRPFFYTKDDMQYLHVERLQN